MLYSPLRVEELAAWDGVVTAKVQATDAHVQDRKTYRAHFCELDVVDSLLGPFEPGETLIAACFGSPLDSGQFAGDDVAESTSLPVDEPEVGSQHTYAIVADSFEGPDGPQGDHYGAVPVVIDQPSDAISLAGSDYQGTFDDDAVQSSAATADSDGNSMPWSEFQTMWNSTAGSS